MMTVIIYFPQTVIETIFFVCLMINVTGVFAYSINILGTIIEDMQRK